MSPQHTLGCCGWGGHPEGAHEMLASGAAWVASCCGVCAALSSSMPASGGACGGGPVRVLLKLRVAALRWLRVLVRSLFPALDHEAAVAARTCAFHAHAASFPAARGHFELVQLILETAVMTEGPERAKRNCIDHANAKRQTALMVACKHGWVERAGYTMLLHMYMTRTPLGDDEGRSPKRLLSAFTACPSVGRSTHCTAPLAHAGTQTLSNTWSPTARTRY